MKKMKVLCCGGGKNNIININNINSINISNSKIVCNGQDISNCFEDILLEEREFNKTINKDIKSYNEEIDTIVIKTSFIDVDVENSSSTNIKAILKGTANISSKDDIKLELSQNKNILTVAIIYDGKLSNSDLSLKVNIPDIKSLIIHSTSADIFINKSVKANVISCDSSSGDIEGTFNSSFINLKTMSGDLLVAAIGSKDLNCNCRTMSGDIELELFNFKDANINTETMSGDITNLFKSDQYSKIFAVVNLETMSGDIEITSNTI